MKTSKEDKEFMDNLHIFNQEFMKAMTTLAKLMNEIFSQLLEGLGSKMIDASDLEVVRE